jgi:hypothetical protein
MSILKEIEECKYILNSKGLNFCIENILRFSKPSEEIIDYYKNQFTPYHWQIVLYNIKLSEDFIESNFDFIRSQCDRPNNNWSLNVIGYSQNLSLDFIKRHLPDLDKKILYLNKNFDRSMKIKIGKLYKQYKDII